MQGQNSSLSIWTALLAESTAAHNRPVHDLKVAWLRQAASANFATVDTSTVGGDDIIPGSDDLAVTKPDLFRYQDETANALSLEYEQSIEEPLGGMVYGEADIVLDNTNNRFTPNINSTIGTAILPNRPVQFALGYYLPSFDFEQPIPIFKGLTGTFRENKGERTVDCHALDYVSFIDNKLIESAIYQDQRTDQIIQDIFVNKLGFSASQLVLDEGLNTVGFAWFTRTVPAGERLRQLLEAEEGHLYQDEQGIIRFENRRHYRKAPHTSVIHSIEAGDIIDWQELERTKVINACRVVAKPREIQSEENVWQDPIVEEVEPGASIDVWAQFENPVTSITTPAQNTDYTANSASDGTGDDESASLSVAITSFTDIVKITLTNSANKKIYVTFLKLRGTPAVVQSELIKLYEDTTSSSKYERNELVIENDFIDDGSFATYLAKAVVTKFKEPRRQIKLTIRAVPQLQVKDYIKIYDQDQAAYINMRLLRIRHTIIPGEYTQTLWLREITDFESDNWAIVDVTQVGSENELVGI